MNPETKEPKQGFEGRPARFPAWSESRRKMLESLPIVEYEPPKHINAESVDKIRALKAELAAKDEAV